MIIYSLRRLASLCVTLVAASLFIFAVMEILPGDPAQLILGINAQEDTLAALREQLGLNLTPCQSLLALDLGHAAR